MPTNKELQEQLKQANQLNEELKLKLADAESKWSGDEVMVDTIDREKGIIYELVKAQMCCTKLGGFSVDNDVRNMIIRAKRVLELLDE